MEAIWRKLINIHPALYQNMAEKNVWINASVSNQWRWFESGITIHYVNEMYDRGRELFFKAKCKVDRRDNGKNLQKSTGTGTQILSGMDRKTGASNPFM